MHIKQLLYKINHTYKYKKELTEMEQLFKQGEKNPPISKNMPFKAG